jgi:hypothetical protein
MPSKLSAPVDFDERHRKLAIVRALLDRLSADLERLADDPALGVEQRAAVDAALELALIAREEFDPLAA